MIPGVLSEVGPDLIINPAAFTAVDRAEDEVEIAYEYEEKTQTDRPVTQQSPIRQNTALRQCFFLCSNGDGRLRAPCQTRWRLEFLWQL
jgi:RmlD substrate binding domain